MLLCSLLKIYFKHRLFGACGPIGVLHQRIQRLASAIRRDRGQGLTFLQRVHVRAEGCQVFLPRKSIRKQPCRTYRSRKDVPISIPYLISWKPETTENQEDVGADDEAVKAANRAKAAALAAAVGAPLNLIAGT